MTLLGAAVVLSSLGSGNALVSYSSTAEVFDSGKSSAEVLASD